MVIMSNKLVILIRSDSSLVVVPCVDSIGEMRELTMWAVSVARDFDL